LLGESGAFGSVRRIPGLHRVQAGEAGDQMHVDMKAPTTLEKVDNIASLNWIIKDLRPMFREDAFMSRMFGPRWPSSSSVSSENAIRW
jgi:hypothetical protein